MKSLPAIAAGMLAAFLLLAPIASAAAPTVSVMVTPTSVTGAQSVSITGTATPSPGAGYEASITVTNPHGTAVALANEPVDPTTGAFAYSFVAGGSNYTWTTGVYTVSATVNGGTGSATFGYTAAGSSSGFNQTRAFLNIEGNLTKIEGQIHTLSNDLNGNATAIKATQAAQGTILTGLQSSMTTLTSDVASLTSSVSAIGTQLTNMQSTLTTINNNVQALNTPINNAATQATNAANAVNSTQTYVLVVAVLAAITLVLELAILVRKLS